MLTSPTGTQPAGTAKHVLGFTPLRLGCLGGLLLLAALTFGPYLLDSQALEREMASQIKATTGLTLEAKAPAQFGLFPQPHLSMAGLRLSGPSGSLTVDADAFSGEVRLFALLGGRLEITSASLIRPALRFDLDAGPVPADSTIGRALNADPGLPLGPGERLGVVNLSEGSAIIASRATGDLTITDINVTLDWRHLDAPAALTGTIRFKGETAHVAAWMGQPSSLMKGDPSPFALRIKSQVLNLLVNGEFEPLPAWRLHGRLMASAPALAPLLGLTGHKPVMPAPFANLSMTSDIAVTRTTADFQNLSLQADGNSYEGTLAYQNTDGVPSLSGTLATEQLSLTPFVSRLPYWTDTDSHEPPMTWKLDPKDQILLDLRISASHLHLPPLAIEDAALSVISRDRRTEVSLAGGKAFGGTLKGRASVALTDSGVDLRATAALTGADASALSLDLLGHQRASGILNASAEFETSGGSINALIGGLNGWSKIRMEDGDLSDIDIGHGLREIARKRPDTVATALRNGRTPFKTLVLDLAINKGFAVITDGSLQGPDAHLTLEGEAALGTRQLKLNANAIAPAGPDPAVPPPQLSFVIQGPFDQAGIVPDAGPQIAP